MATLFYIISSTESCICPTMTREQRFCNSDFSELFQSLCFEDFFSCTRTKYLFLSFWIDNHFIVLYEEIDSIFNYIVLVLLSILGLVGKPVGKFLTDDKNSTVHVIQVRLFNHLPVSTYYYYQVCYYFLSSVLYDDNQFWSIGQKKIRLFCITCVAYVIISLMLNSNCIKFKIIIKVNSSFIQYVIAENWIIRNDLYSYPSYPILV